MNVGYPCLTQMLGVGNKFHLSRRHEPYCPLQEPKPSNIASLFFTSTSPTLQQPHLTLTTRSYSFPYHTLTNKVN